MSTACTSVKETLVCGAEMLTGEGFEQDVAQKTSWDSEGWSDASTAPAGHMHGERLTTKLWCWWCVCVWGGGLFCAGGGGLF